MTKCQIKVAKLAEAERPEGVLIKYKEFGEKAETELSEHMADWFDYMCEDHKRNILD